MRSFIGVLLLLLASAAFAETGYVTDRLRLGLHQAEDTSDTPFRYLESGDEFEILSRTRYYAQVQLPDGETGYLKLSYVVFEPPAKLIVNQTQAENDRLSAQLEETKASFAEPAALIDSLKAEAASLKTELDASNAKADELAAEHQSMVDRQARYRYSLPITWVGGAIFACLIAGFLLGLWWVDRQSRRRHGGIRVL